MVDLVDFVSTVVRLESLCRIVQLHLLQEVLQG